MIFVVIYSYVFFFHYFDVESQQTSFVLENIARMKPYVLSVTIREKQYSMSRTHKFDSAPLRLIVYHAFARFYTVSEAMVSKVIFFKSIA